ncbi:hypothetical protein BDV93DRAFT_520005 [Ceratobasidium sp. AG-I]|nr:hypothetical protein BDV93DRAFT_520005 [Ceratobasidium sp. AG-I]
MYNGFGGKVDPGETVLAAGVRELKEEAGIDAPLEPCGLLFFVGEGESFAHHIAVFRATTYTGTITESDEMRPQWFAFPPPPSSPSHPSSTSPPLDNSADEPALPEFPYSQMWKDDPLWFPLLLANTPFVARVDYGPITAGQEIESGMQRWWVATVEEDAFRKAKVWEV